MASMTDATCSSVTTTSTFTFGDEVHHVGAAPVDLLAPAGAAEALHLGDGHALDADLGEGVLHLVELERLDDRFDPLHREPVSTATLPPFATADRVDLVFVVDGQTSVQTLPEAGRLVIGRATEVNVCVPHRSLSREHASITMPGLVIEDLGSTNGTFVRRAQPDGTISESPLKHGESIALAPGDSMRLGAVTVVLVPTFLRDEPSARGGDRSAVVVDDPAMRAIYAMIDRVAASDIPVLILGETGVGKEVLAETIHRESPRRGQPFLRLNCAALSESLLSSELFGHERGAFTGALQAKIGLLESANGGTVFLDEVGDLPMPIQVKLLRVLEERQVLRVGAVKPRLIDVRFLAATNRDLEAEIEHGNFRQDLFFRLNGISIVIPPLRERRGRDRGPREGLHRALGRYREIEARASRPTPWRC
jgi:two-component system response regulator AtoC